jgi:predicted nucleotide-binding protein
VGAGASAPGLSGNGLDPRAVLVVYGRDVVAKQAVFALLRDLDLRPLDWEQLVAITGSAAPYVGDAVARAFPLVQAVVVILTPDDEARLLPVLHGPNEPRHEKELTGQARPNVLFEAGMALALHPDRTVLAEIGRVRPFSDVAGRHMVRLTGAPASLNSLAMKLKSAGCPVDTTGSGWLDESRFRNLGAYHRSADGAPSQT